MTDEKISGFKKGAIIFACLILVVVVVLALIYKFSRQVDVVNPQSITNATPEALSPTAPTDTNLKQLSIETVTPEDVIEKLQEKQTEYKEHATTNEPPPSLETAYTIQVGAFKDSAQADQLMLKLRKKGLPAYQSSLASKEKGLLHRVRIGHFANRNDAQIFATELEQKDRLSTYVTKNVD